MPDIETLMDVWPEEFESLLDSVSLPPPELDLSLLEYVKTLCAILDIPVYDNPIESLHLMFSLFIEFRNNPHFQARLGGGMGGGGGAEEKGGEIGGRNMNFGGADVMQIDQN